MKGRSCWHKPDTCVPQTATVEDLQCYEQPNSADFLNKLDNVLLWQLVSTHLNNWHRLHWFPPIVTDRLCLKRPSALTGAEQKSSGALLGWKKISIVSLACAYACWQGKGSDEAGGPWASQHRDWLVPQRARDADKERRFSAALSKQLDRPRAAGIFIRRAARSARSSEWYL